MKVIYMILGIDQGTTGTTVIIFNKDAEIVSKGYNEFTQYFPKPSWVEHDPLEILLVTEKTIQLTLDNAKMSFNDIDAIGITNQRETTVIWDKTTGLPVYNAIVWQCRRTLEMCNQIKDNGHEAYIKKTTGLVVDAYFSGTKIKWILDQSEDHRKKAEQGNLCFGTIDTWLIWNFSKGKYHVTDHTNASRTMIYNISTLNWDEKCLEILNIPKLILPRIINSTNTEVFTSEQSIFKKEIPISGIAGDQQAALFGQLCFEPGMIKNTYGTGCFILMYLGEKAVYSDHGLLTTVAINSSGKPAYALEGSVFMGGAIIQWLRDQLQLLTDSQDSEELALKVESSEGVYLVPAFVGLGAPHWKMDARASITGLTRGSNKYHIIRSALESIALQCYDLFQLMTKETDLKLTEIRVDGGASMNDFLMQMQADLTHTKVSRPFINESTVFGAALLAGLGSGFYKSSDLSRLRKIEKEFLPTHNKYLELISGWHKAVKQILEAT